MEIMNRLYAALLVGAGVLTYLVAAKKQPTPLRTRLTAGLGAVLVLSGFALVLPMGQPKGLVVWTPYAPGVLEAAAAEHKPVVFDFYADWCVPCHEMDRTTYTDARVAAALEPFVRVKADLTDMRSPVNEALIEKFELDGLPAVLFLDGNGEEIREARIFGYASPSEMLMAIHSPVVGARLAEAPAANASAEPSAV